MKKRLLALLLAVLTACNLLIPSAVAAEPESAASPEAAMATYYVSPAGSDSNDGTSPDRPFATLEHARDTVRTVNRNMTGDIVVYLMDGTWELDQTLRFSEADSGTNGYNVWYKAYDGASPLLSGGTKLESQWEQTTVNNGVTAYKTTLERDVKLRALYVNGERRYMAKMENAIYAFGPWMTYDITKGMEDWAWADGQKYDCFCYYQYNFPENFSDETRNVTDIEIENQFVWNKNIVCVRDIQEGTQGDWDIFLQQPYGAIAQTPGWGVNFSANSPHVLHNAYEFLDQPGEFYFDRAGQTLYYIPLEGEDMRTAEVVVPRLETVVEFRGNPEVTGEMEKAGADNKTITGQVQNVIFDGISVAHSDWNLQKVGDSYGKSTVQAGTVLTAFASGNWHADMYRNLDTLPGAVEMEFAHDVIFRNGAVMLTGGEGIVLSNDVDGCQVIGNYIYQTGGGGVLVGHPQHVYENDSLEPDVYYYHHIEGDGKPEVSDDGAGAEHEKYQNGTERAPRDVKVSNNYLLENCRLFPSHCPITSYYTQRLEISNNFIKDAAYSGMSIGWGWGNFDGETNGDRWGTENNQGYAIIPNIPTEVCRDNQVINNRLDGTMTILHDGGLIYTLGKQDNTLIAGNYGRGSESGLYPDEGSAMFAPIQNNVVADLTSRAYAGGQYGRKHDLLFKNNYSNNNIPEAGPDYNIRSEEFHYIADSVWPKEASDIIQKSGLTVEYRAKFADQLVDVYGSIQDALMPQMAWFYTGEQLTLNAWLDEDDEIWLAPAGTTEFAEGDTMTRAAGNAVSMDLPSQPGTYYLYAVMDGEATAASRSKIEVRDIAGAANVKDGETYQVSSANPLTLELDTLTYTFRLNGQEIADGQEIAEAGQWKLEAFSGGSDTASLTFRFTTWVSAINQLMPDHCWLEPGETLELPQTLGDAEQRIWLAPVGAETFDPETAICIPGDQTTIPLPDTEGQYQIAVVNGEGVVTGRTDTIVTVSKDRLPLGYTLRLAADAAETIAADADGVISAWANMANADETFTPVVSGPVWTTDENGIPCVSFNGADQSLNRQGFAFNGKEALTVVIMARTDETNYSEGNAYGAAYGDGYSPIYANEASGWSGLYVSPYEDWVAIRFGSTITNCYVSWEREEPMTMPSVTGAVKDGTAESIYVNGGMVYRKDGQAAQTAGIGDTLYIGNSIVAGSNSYFCGELYEVLIYDRALTADEMQAVSDSMLARYSAAVPVTGVSLDRGSLTLTEGESDTLIATVEPADAADKAVTWTTSDHQVAAVDNGMVTAVAEGKATITVTTVDGGFTDTCEVTVEAKDVPHVHEGTLVAAVEPTCTQDGSKAYYQCECGEFFEDADCTIKIADLDRWKVVPATGHTYQWAHDEDQHWKVCTACQTIDESTRAAHTWVKDDERSDSETIWYTCQCGAEKFEQQSSGGGGGSAVVRYTVTVTQSAGGRISPSTTTVTRGADKTFTIAADEGYAISDVLVDGRSVGPVSEYTFENVSAKHTLTAKFEKAEEASNVAGFTDVQTDDWFAEAVQYAVDEGLMNGTSETTFAPNGDTTRGMIVTILYRLAGSPDVESDGKTWWSDARAWAMEKGVSDGTNMEGKITREQLAAMLYRYAGSEEVDGDLSAFTDAASVSDWAVDALIWATNEGIVTGKTGNVLDPQAGATRAETAAMFQRLDSTIQ